MCIRDRFNTLPKANPTNATTKKPDDLGDLWFWYDDDESAEGNVGWGRYELKRVSYAGSSLKLSVSAQSVLLSELVRNNVYEATLAMRERTRRKGLWELLTGRRPVQRPTKAELGDFEGWQVFENTNFDANDFVYKPSTAALPGKLTFDDIMYCVRLSQLAYFGNPISFFDFFPPEREDLLLDDVWRSEVVRRNLADQARLQVTGENDDDLQLKETAYQMFMVQQCASFFNKDIKDVKDFGMSMSVEKPLGDMKLELYKPTRPLPKHVRVTPAGALAWGDKLVTIAYSKGLETEGGDVCVFFEGTNSFADVQTDLNGITMSAFDPMRDGDGPTGAKAHYGFYRTFMKLKSALHDALDDLLNRVPADKNVRLVVTGHSLGGALAQLTLGWLLLWFDEAPGREGRRFHYRAGGGDHVGIPPRCRLMCVTFGQPKVGNAALVNWMATHPLLKTTFVRAIKDVAPHGEGYLTLKEGDVVELTSSDPDASNWVGTCQRTKQMGMFPKDQTIPLRSNESRPWVKYLRIFSYYDPVPKLPPTSLGYEHLHRNAAIIDTEGELYFMPKQIAQEFEHTTDAIRDLLLKSMSIAQYHSLLIYLHRAAHFAQRITADLPTGMLAAFGDVDYQQKTRREDFLNNF